MKNSTPEKLADKWIRQMQKANFTPDQMLECLKLAREKYEVMVYTKNRYQEFHKIATTETLVDSLTNINRIIEKERFNKIMEKTFPIISGNGILNSVYDVSDSIKS
jgi:carbamoylphosphate synthase large subunit